MKRNLVSITIVMLACIIVSIIATVMHYDLYRFIFTLLSTMIIFLIVGNIVQSFIHRTIELSDKDKKDNEVDASIENVDDKKMINEKELENNDIE